MLKSCLLSDDPDDYMVQVSLWEAFSHLDQHTKDTAESGRHRANFYRLTSFVSEEDNNDGPESVATRRPSQRFDTAQEIVEPCLAESDLWTKDDVCQNETRNGYVMSPAIGGHGCYDVTGGPGANNNKNSPSHRRHATFDASLLSAHHVDNQETLVIKDRLHGYVRPHPGL